MAVNEQTYRVMHFRGRWSRKHLVSEGQERALCGASGGRIDGEARAWMPPKGHHNWLPRQRCVVSINSDELCWHCQRLATCYP